MKKGAQAEGTNPGSFNDLRRLIKFVSIISSKWPETLLITAGRTL
jgi:hypothetical protein